MNINGRDQWRAYAEWFGMVIDTVARVFLNSGLPNAGKNVVSDFDIEFRAPVRLVKASLRSTTVPSKTF